MYQAGFAVYITLARQPMNIEPLSSLDEILPVLTGCDLQVTDITASSPPLFFGFRVAGSVVAVIGLEQFQSAGLLRSLAVSPNYRGRGLAQKLLRHVESFAASHGVESLFLLTTTAEAFFRKRGYCKASRLEAPQAIQATSWSWSCPNSPDTLTFLNQVIGFNDIGIQFFNTQAPFKFVG